MRYERFRTRNWGRIWSSSILFGMFGSKGPGSFTVVLTTPACPLGMEFQERCEEAVRRLPGVRDVAITITGRMDRSMGNGG